MKVTLIDNMGSDLTVVNAARVSFHKKKDVFDESDAKLIRYLATHQHWTPFSHPTLTLLCKAPIFVARQLFKHKVGLTENEVSRRYVDEAPEFYTPDHWRGRPKGSAKQGSSDEVIESMLFSGIEESGKGSPDSFYQSHLQTSLDLYLDMINNGIAPEQARMVLPQSMMTEWYWTGSLAAFSRVCKLRLDSHAQNETREIAQMISDIIEPLYPCSWKALQS